MTWNEVPIEEHLPEDVRVRMAILREGRRWFYAILSAVLVGAFVLGAVDLAVLTELSQMKVWSRVQPHGQPLERPGGVADGDGDGLKGSGCLLRCGLCRPYVPLNLPGDFL